MNGLLAEPVLIAFQLVGLSLLAAFVSGAAAFLFRWRVGTSFPEGPGLLLGLAAVGVVLNTRLVLVQFLGEEGEALAFGTVVVDLGIFLVCGVAAFGGWYAGDRLGSVERFSRLTIQPTLSPLVRATGRYITVSLPDEIADIEGYDPVSEATKTALAGATYTFSRGLTVDGLRAALETRLKMEHDIGHIDVDLVADGTVEFLAVGRRVSGIGPTLPTGSAATAIRADPAFSASPGDTVQIWDPTTDRRLGTAELRASVDRIVTISARESVVAAVDPRSEYRLMTLAADERADRAFAAMLRRADETMSAVDVAEGSTLASRTVGELGLSVIAIRAADGTTSTIPTRGRPLSAGDRLFAIGHPTQLRRLEAAATGTAPYEPPAVEAGEQAEVPDGLLGRLRRRLGPKRAT